MVSKEFQIRAIDRAHVEQKEGKSIIELIREGKFFGESLLKEEEMLLQSEMKMERERHPHRFENSDDGDEPDEEGTLIEINGEWLPEFDKRGLGINY